MLMSQVFHALYVDNKCLLNNGAMLKKIRKVRSRTLVSTTLPTLGLTWSQ